MAFSNRVIQQAIKEQTRGRIPDLQRIKREQQEAERKGKLYCRWDKDKKGCLCYNVFIRDTFDREIKAHSFYKVSSSMVQQINAVVANYNKTHRVFLSQASRNPNMATVKRIQNELDSLVFGYKYER